MAERHGAEVIVDGLPWSGPLVRHEGEAIKLRLWWSADRQIERDAKAGKLDKLAARALEHQRAGRTTKL